MRGTVIVLAIIVLFAIYINFARVRLWLLEKYDRARHVIWTLRHK